MRAAAAGPIRRPARVASSAAGPAATGVQAGENLRPQVRRQLRARGGEDIRGVSGGCLCQRKGEWPPPPRTKRNVTPQPQPPAPLFASMSPSPLFYSNSPIARLEPIFPSPLFSPPLDPPSHTHAFSLPRSLVSVLSSLHLFHPTESGSPFFPRPSRDPAPPPRHGPGIAGRRPHRAQRLGNSPENGRAGGRRGAEGGGLIVGGGLRGLGRQEAGGG